jgi:hypothetical protein
LQSAFFGIDAQRIESLAGELETQIHNFRLLEVATSSRDELELGYIENEEIVFEPFILYEDATRAVGVPAGRYTFDQIELSAETAGQRRFSGGVEYANGDFFGGTIQSIESEITWKRANLALSLGYEWNDVELPQGDFISRLVSLSSAYAFSSSLYWITLIQYDNVSEEVGVNTRLQWIPKAGQEGFIVFNHNLQDLDKDNSFHSAASDFSVKFKYTFRF